MPRDAGPSERVSATREEAVKTTTMMMTFATMTLGGFAALAQTPTAVPTTVTAPPTAIDPALLMAPGSGDGAAAEAEVPRLDVRVDDALSLPSLAIDLREEGIDPDALQDAFDAFREADLRADEVADVLETERDATREGSGGGPEGNFGAFVQTQLDAGLRGRDLAAAIHARHAVDGRGSHGAAHGRPAHAGAGADGSGAAAGGGRPDHAGAAHGGGGRPDHAGTARGGSGRPDAAGAPAGREGRPDSAGVGGGRPDHAGPPANHGGAAGSGQGARPDTTRGGGPPAGRGPTSQPMRGGPNR